MLVEKHAGHITYEDSTFKRNQTTQKQTWILQFIKEHGFPLVNILKNPK